MDEMDKEQGKSSQTSRNCESKSETNSRCKSRRARRKRLQQRLEADQAKSKISNISNKDTDIQIHISDQIDYYNILKTLPPKLQSVSVSVPCQTLPIPNIDITTVANEMEFRTNVGVKQKSNANTSRNTKVTQSNKNAQNGPKLIANEIEKKIQKENSKIKEDNPTNKKSNNEPISVQQKPVNNNDIVQDQGIKKSREEILAEREAKKAAKQAKKLGKNIQKPEETQKSVDTVDNIQINNKISDIQNINVESSIIKNGPEEGGKSKAVLRAERRQLQEAQRLAKSLATNENKKGKTDENKPSNKPVKSQEKTSQKSKITKIEDKVTYNNKFYRISNRAIKRIEEFDDLSEIFWCLGLKYSKKLIVGSNARCIALIFALKQLVSEYETPPNKEFSRALDEKIKYQIKVLNYFYPISVSMINVFKSINRQLNHLPNSIQDNEAKKTIIQYLDTYLKEQIHTATTAISDSLSNRISDGDVILTYQCSNVIEKTLIDAKKNGKKFHVIVAFDRYVQEGSVLIERLINEGIECSFVLLNTVGFIIRKVTKVLFGAHSVYANGYVMSRSGTTQIALAANALNIPILICCETHKFTDRVCTSPFDYNERDELFKDTIVFDESKKVTVKTTQKYWTLHYDIIPSSLITALVTELAIIPCTSAPVILRIKAENGYY